MKQKKPVIGMLFANSLAAFVVIGLSERAMTCVHMSSSTSLCLKSGTLFLDGQTATILILTTGSGDLAAATYLQVGRDGRLFLQAPPVRSIRAWFLCDVEHQVTS